MWILTVCELPRPERTAGNRTRAELIAVAERRFSADGYHATSLDVVADEAGFTKGAVYSNFASKEDLFFAVYERRVDALRRRRRGACRRPPTVDAEVREQRRRGGRPARRTSDGWLAVFFEFWAHVLRHPEHRARFAELHGRGDGAARRRAGRGSRPSAGRAAGPRLARAGDRA